MTREEQVKAQIARLGESWIMHPNYVRASNPAHTYHGSFILTRFFDRKNRFPRTIERVTK